MTLLESIKPFWPLIFTVVLPRAISFYRELRTSARTRPPARPLSKYASRSLNILFVSICIFLWVSYSTNSQHYGLSNVFATTQTRLGVPSDMLFSRLALRRSNGMLTADDEALRSKFTSMSLRSIYLKVGPDPIINCPFCHPDDPNTYILNALPTQVLFPHLTHLLLIGLATSKSISGSVAAAFRFRASFFAIAIAILDIYLTSIHEFAIDAQKPAPLSFYASAIILRPLIFCITDSILAFLIYVTATNRFILFPFLASAANTANTEDPEELIERTKTLLHESNTNIGIVLMKLRGVNVTQNTIRRDATLKQNEDKYWNTVQQIESPNGAGHIDPEIFEEEEVQAAIARAFGSGNVDVAGIKREAEGFVREVTRGLDQGVSST